MPTTEARLLALERGLKQVQGVASAIQGDPASATISIPHNDSWLFEDNVDGAGGFPGNLRYIISANVQRVVSAKLSIHLAAYRTYSSFTVSATSNPSVDHTHVEATHNHGLAPSAGAGGNAVTWLGGFLSVAGVFGSPDPTSIQNTSPGNTTGASVAHTHLISGSSFLGITEGVVATGVSLSFDGVDHTADLGGPFSSDVIELDILRFLPTTKSALHVIAMQTTGLGRLEAHLRLGVYVSAGSVF